MRGCFRGNAILVVLLTELRDAVRTWIVGTVDELSGTDPVPRVKLVGGGEADLQDFFRGKLQGELIGDEYDGGGIHNALDGDDMAVCFDADTYRLFGGAETVQYRQVFLS